jgi:hypothetical protein
MGIRVTTLILVAAVLAIAGCGGSSKNTTSNTSTRAGSTGTVSTSSSTTGAVSTTADTSKALSNARLVAQADAICKRLNTKLDNGNDNASTQQDIVRIAPQRAATEQTALNELSKLTPPASMADDYQQMLADRQTVIEDIKKLGDDAAANDSSAEIPVYKSSSAVTEQLATTAKRSGFRYCGEVG